MKKSPLLGTVCAFLFTFITVSANAGVISLDADSISTGLNLDTSSLVTTEGTITFSGEITNLTDPEFTVAGATGNNFDIISSGASLSFDFDVISFEFIYGGNRGEFDIVARDIADNTVASFNQASTDSGQPAGPVTLSGKGIRSIFWNDTMGNFAAIDNITITTVPIPASVWLFGSGLIGLVGVARRKRSR